VQQGVISKGQTRLQKELNDRERKGLQQQLQRGEFTAYSAILSIGAGKEIPGCISLGCFASSKNGGILGG
jgi:hypothetical protein